MIKSLYQLDIYKFLWNGGVGFQKSPPAGSDFALRATQGQSRLLETHISSLKTLNVENKVKIGVLSLCSTFCIINLRGREGPILFSYTIFMYICYVKKVFSIRIMNI